MIVKNIKEKWRELSAAGKLLSWWFIPVYYLTFVLIAVVVFVFLSAIEAWDDFFGICR